MDAAFLLKDRSDQELLDGVWAAIGRETEDVAIVIAHLAEIDKRKLFAEEGCGSLKSYCMEVLHLSEDQAYTRIGVARVARKFPVVLEMLADGLVHLTAVLRLGPSMTDDNHLAILGEATYKSMAEVEEMVARLRPKAPAPTTICKVTSKRANPEQEDRLFVDPSDSPACEVESEPERPEFYRKSIVSPIAPDLYDFHFTGDGEMADALKLLQDLLSHRVPNGDPVLIMKDALLMRLKQVQRQRYGKGRRPRKAASPRREAALPPTEGMSSTASAEVVSSNARVDKAEDPDKLSRYIPDDVKQAVWERDQGRCAFRSIKGRWCTERRFLEFHHIIPFAWKGETTVDNLELRCRTHNAYEGELLFGKVLRRKAWSLPVTRFKTSGTPGNQEQPRDQG